MTQREYTAPDYVDDYEEDSSAFAVHGSWLLSPLQEELTWSKRDRQIQSERMIRAQLGLGVPESMGGRALDGYDEDGLPLIFDIGTGTWDPKRVIDLTPQSYTAASRIITFGETLDAVGPQGGIVSVAAHAAGINPINVVDIAMLSRQMEIDKATNGVMADQGGEPWYKMGDNIVKGTSRWVFGAFDAWIDTVFDRPTRLNDLRREGEISWGEQILGTIGMNERADDLAGQHWMFNALSNPMNLIDPFLPGEQAPGQTNLSTGYFGSSELAPGHMEDMAAYQAMLESGQLDNEVMTKYGPIDVSKMNEHNRMMVQDSLGREYFFNESKKKYSDFYKQVGEPITEDTRMTREAVIAKGTPLFGVSAFGHNMNPNDLYRQSSFGRALAGLFTEPGTDEFRWMSGITDGAKQIFGDLGAPLSDINAVRRAGRRVLGLTDQARALDLGARNADDVAQELAKATEKATSSIDEVSKALPTPTAPLTSSLDESLKLRNRIIKDYIESGKAGDLPYNEAWLEGNELFMDLAEKARRGDSGGVRSLIDDLYMGDVRRLSGETTRTSLAARAAENAKLADELPELLEDARNFKGDAIQRLKKAVEETFDTPEEQIAAWDEFSRIIWDSPDEAADFLFGSGPRQAIDPNNARNFLTGRNAEPWLESLVNAKSMDEIDAILDPIERAGGFIDPKDRVRLLNSNSTAEALDVVLPYVDKVQMKSGLWATTQLPGQRALVYGATAAGGVGAGVGQGMELYDEGNLFTPSGLLEVGAATLSGAALGLAGSSGGVSALARATGRAGDIRPTSVTDAWLAGMRGAVQDTFQAHGGPASLLNRGIRTQQRYLGSTNALARRFTQMAPRNVNLLSSRDAYRDYRLSMKNFGLGQFDRMVEFSSSTGGVKRTRALLSSQFDSIDEFEDAVKAMRTDGWNVERSVDLQKSLVNVASTEGGNFEAYYKQFSDLMSIANRTLRAKGVSDEAADAATQLMNYDALTAALKDMGADAMYFTNAVGDTVTTPGSSVKVIVDGKEFNMPAPQLITELFNGHLPMPDSAMLRRVVNNTDRIGKLTNTITTVGGEGLQQRVLVRAATVATQSFFKPLVLFRLAFPIRVIGIDEQARMAASNLESVWSHPISYFSYLLGRKFHVDEAGDVFIKVQRRNGKRVRGALSHGKVTDDLLTKVDDLTWLELTEDASNALSIHSMVGDGSFGTYGSNVWLRIKRGNKHFYDAMASEFRQIWRDPIARHLFSAPTGASMNPITDTVNWLMHGSGRRYLERVMAQVDDGSLSAIDNPAFVQRYVEGVYARGHLKAGGDFQYITKEGRIISSGMQDIGPAPKGARPDSYVITRKGNDELIQSFGTGKLGDLNVGKGMGRGDWKTVQKQLKQIDERLQNSATPLPDYYKGSRSGIRASAEGIWASYQRVIDSTFDFLASKPTRLFSRSPAFSQFYYEQIGRMWKGMDQKTAQFYLDLAREDGMENILLRAIEGNLPKLDTSLEYAPNAVETAVRERILKLKVGVANPTITSIEDVDLVAKTYALTNVQDLLFDLSKKQNISESLKIVAPFAEAFREAFVAWGHVLANNPYKTPRRLGQLIEGAREAEVKRSASTWFGYRWSTDSDWEMGIADDARVGDQQGFFFNNDFGQEVFAYPIYGKIVKALTGQESMMEGNIGSFNMVFGGADFSDPKMPEIGGFPAALFVPGIGWVAQAAVSPFMNEDPQWDGVKSVLFPFGDPLDQGVEGLMGYVPPWLRQMVMGWSSWLRSPEMERQYNNLLIEQNLMLLSSGRAGYGPEFEFDLSTEAGSSSAAAVAKNNVKWNATVLGTARFFGPSGPSAHEIMVGMPDEASDDQVLGRYTIRAIADQFFKILSPTKANGEPLKEDWADPDYRRYMELYGLRMPDGSMVSPAGDVTMSFQSYRMSRDTTISPLPLVIAKTKREANVFTTVEGWEWQRNNAEMWESLPLSAAYLAPPDLNEGPFDFEAWIGNERAGNLERKTPDEIANEQRNFLRQYDIELLKSAAHLEWGNITKSEDEDAWREREEFLRRGTAEISRRYGYPTDQTFEMPMWESTLNEIVNSWRDPTMWKKYDPDEKFTDTVSPVIKYLWYREEAQRELWAQNPTQTLGTYGELDENGEPVTSIGRLSLGFSEDLTNVAKDLMVAYPDGGFRVLWEDVFSQELQAPSQQEQWEENVASLYSYNMEYQRQQSEAGR